MAGLQRSALSFRRQGSSGLVWDDKFLSELNQKEATTTTTMADPQDSAAGSTSGEQPPKEVVLTLSVAVRAAPSRSTPESVERSRSNRGFRTGRVSPAIEPPSPKVSACGLCNAFGGKNDKSHRRSNSGKRKM